MTETGKARPQGKSRTLIRSLARRKPANRVIVTKRHILAADSDRDNVRLGEGIDRDDLLVHPKHQYPDKGLTHFPGKTTVDPFLTMPVSEVGNSQFFIHYCEST